MTGRPAVETLSSSPSRDPIALFVRSTSRDQSGYSRRLDG